MRISLSPRLSAAPIPDASVLGDVLTIGGVEYDFGPLAEGDILPRSAVDCHWLASDVTRENGRIALTLALPHGATAPEAARFPQPILAEDGPLSLPPYDEVSE